MKEGTFLMDKDQAKQRSEPGLELELELEWNWNGDGTGPGTQTGAPETITAGLPGSTGG
jgi:hypothetical protein